MAIRSFLDLDVYKRSYNAALTVHKEIIPRLPESEKYDLKDQAGRSSKAIPAIIAEGYARKHHKKDWQKYIDNAIGEANEMIVHLSLTKDIYPKFVNVKLCESLIEEYNITGKQLFNLGQSWKNFSHPKTPLPDPPHTSLSSLHSLILPLTIGGAQIPVPKDLQRLMNLQNPLESILRWAVGTIIIIGIALTAIFIIIAGIQWITSGGNKEGLQKAKARITYSIIGLIVILLSFFIIKVIGGLFEANLI